MRPLLLAASLAWAAPGASGAAPRQAPFAELARCGEAPGGWCLEPAFPEGKPVRVLGKDCRGLTEPRGRVRWTACARPDAGDLAVVGARVEGYRLLKVERLRDEASRKRVEKLIRGTPGFAERLARVEARLRKDYAAAGRRYEEPELSLDSLGGRALLATFDPEGGDALPFLVVKTRVTPLTEGPERCGAAKDAFLAGGKAWLRLSDCACGTDRCRPTFWPLD